jgi:lipopolysaccharide transport system ATP-binding protein
MAAAIEFDRVSKHFLLRQEAAPGWRARLQPWRARPAAPAFHALRDVSFDVAAGESFALVGHNGAGKSTTLKLMTRILAPSAGRVAVHGRVAALLELGSGFHPDLTGRDNIFLYGSLLGLSRRDMRARLDEIVAFADMADFLDMEVKHYSSGMYTRLAFAVATAVDPEILITDEVLAVGDEAFQRKCLERIYTFRREGRTIIFVTHALETVRTLCDRAIWLDRGVARALGPTSQVVDAYLADVNRRLAAETGQPASDGAHRYGSRELEITAVTLLDAAGTPTTTGTTGQPFTIRLHYQAHEPVDSPAFGLAIHHEGGLVLSGPNTRLHGVELARISGSGTVEYRLPALPLLAGIYLLTVAVYDQALIHPFDHQDRMHRFSVVDPVGRVRSGVFDGEGQWRVTLG